MIGNRQSKLGVQQIAWGAFSWVRCYGAGTRYIAG